jgi:hypothetical protein
VVEFWGNRQHFKWLSAVSVSLIVAVVVGSFLPHHTFVCLAGSLKACTWSMHPFWEDCSSSEAKISPLRYIDRGSHWLGNFFGSSFVDGKSVCKILF